MYFCLTSDVQICLQNAARDTSHALLHEIAGNVISVIQEKLKAVLESVRRLQRNCESSVWFGLELSVLAGKTPGITISEGIPNFLPAVPRQVCQRTHKLSFGPFFQRVFAAFSVSYEKFAKRNFLCKISAKIITNTQEICSSQTRQKIHYTQKTKTFDFENFMIINI